MSHEKANLSVAWMKVIVKITWLIRMELIYLYRVLILKSMNGYKLPAQQGEVFLDLGCSFTI